MIKLSLVGLFVMTMATLTLAASTLPPAVAADLNPVVVAVAPHAVVRTGGSMAGNVPMPKGAVPKAATELMASL